MRCRPTMTDTECARVAKIAQQHGRTLECGDDGQGDTLYWLKDGGEHELGFRNLRDAEAAAGKAEALWEALFDD